MNKSLFSHILSKICCHWFLHLIHSHFCLLFKDGYQYRTELEMSIRHFYFLFRKFCSFPDQFIDWWVILVFQFCTSLYILDLILLSEMWLEKIFSCCRDWLFIPLITFFVGQKSFNFIWSNLLILGAISCIIGEEVIS